MQDLNPADITGIKRKGYLKDKIYELATNTKNKINEFKMG
jgi:hypothetical protein